MVVVVAEAAANVVVVVVVLAAVVRVAAVANLRHHRLLRHDHRNYLQVKIHCSKASGLLQQANQSVTRLPSSMF